MTKALEAIKDLEIDEIKNRVRMSPSHTLTKRYLEEKNSSFTEDQVMNLSSVLTGLLQMAWMDRDLTELEVKYIIREAKGWCDLDQEGRKYLVDIHSHLVTKVPKFEDHIANHMAFLRKSLNTKQKEKFFEDLVIISRADLEIEKREVNLLKKVARFLNVDIEKQDEFLVNAKFIVIQRLEEAAGETPLEVLERPYSIPIIKLEFN